MDGISVLIRLRSSSMVFNTGINQHLVKGNRGPSPCPPLTLSTNISTVMQICCTRQACGANQHRRRPVEEARVQPCDSVQICAVQLGGWITDIPVVEEAAVEVGSERRQVPPTERGVFGVVSRLQCRRAPHRHTLPHRR